MVSQQRLQAGIAKYIDQEFTSKIEGWKRWGVGIGSALILESLPVTLQRWQASELGAMLGIFGDGGDIDIEKLYTHAKRQAQQGPLVVQLPALGPVRFTGEDVDKLYRCIMEG